MTNTNQEDSTINDRKAAKSLGQLPNAPVTLGNPQDIPVTPPQSKNPSPSKGLRKFQEDSTSSQESPPLCQYCGDYRATIQCYHDHIQDVSDHIFLCGSCHHQTWGGTLMCLADNTEVKYYLPKDQQRKALARLRDNTKRTKKG